MEVLPWTVLLIVVTVVTEETSCMYVSNSYRDIHGHHLQTMDRDHRTGEFIVASQKHIIAKLSPDLSLLQVENIKGGNSTAVFNKVVVVDEESKTVILCSTSGDGSCEIRSLNDLSQIVHTHPIPIVPNNVFLKTKVIQSNNPKQLHFANDFKNSVPSLITNAPTISSRNINNLNLVNNNMNGSSSKSVIRNLPKNYQVQYIYGFSHSGYIYFISLQSQPLRAANTLITKISRICIDDQFYRSLVEVQLDCVASARTVFPHILTAYFNQGSGKLFTGFTRMDQMDHAVSQGPSALCIFDIDSINTLLDKTVQDCYHGNGRLGPAHFHEVSSCLKTVSLHILFH